MICNMQLWWLIDPVSSLEYELRCTCIYHIHHTHPALILHLHKWLVIFGESMISSCFDPRFKQYLSLFQDRVQCISLEEGSSFRKAAQRNATLLNQANIGLFWTPAFSLDNKYEVFFLILDEQPILGVLPCHTYLIIPWASQSMQFKETEHFLTNDHSHSLCKSKYWLKIGPILSNPSIKNSSSKSYSKIKHFFVTVFFTLGQL